MKVGENATFINWRNIKIINIKRYFLKSVFCSFLFYRADFYNFSIQLCRVNDEVIVKAEPNIENGNFYLNKTPKLTWLAVSDQVKYIRCTFVYFDHIISKPFSAKDDDFKQFLNKNTNSFFFREWMTINWFVFLHAAWNGDAVWSWIGQTKKMVTSFNFNEEVSLLTTHLTNLHRKIHTLILPFRSLIY